MKTLTAFLFIAFCLLHGKVYPSEADCTPIAACSAMIISEDNPEYYMLPSDAEITPAEFQLLKKTLAKAISQYNQKIGFGTDSKYFRIEPLAAYGVQYKVTLTKKGEKEVWINGFCKDSSGMYHADKLTSEPVIVFDGGSCYFNTVISLKKRKASRIIIHGFA